MVELATINELLPATTPLFPVMLGLPVGEPEKIEQAKQKVSAVLKFFESLLESAHSLAVKTSLLPNL